MIGRRELESLDPLFASMLQAIERLEGSEGCLHTHYRQLKHILDTQFGPNRRPLRLYPELPIYPADPHGDVRYHSDVAEIAHQILRDVLRPEKCRCPACQLR